MTAVPGARGLAAIPVGLGHVLRHRTPWRRPWRPLSTVQFDPPRSIGTVCRLWRLDEQGRPIGDPIRVGEVTIR